jgi:hypothetical protein
MSSDAERKRELLKAWCGDFTGRFAVRLLGRAEPLDKDLALGRLKDLTTGLAVYLLFVEEKDGLAPVYIGRADDTLVRWGQHLDGWLAGKRSYAAWRRKLLDADGRALANLLLLVVPASAITQPPIPGFPCTVGSVEYQLVGLAEDAFPGRLLNHEGKGRC